MRRNVILAVLIVCTVSSTVAVGCSGATVIMGIGAIAVDLLGSVLLDRIMEFLTGAGGQEVATASFGLLSAYA